MAGVKLPLSDVFKRPLDQFAERSFHDVQSPRVLWEGAGKTVRPGEANDTQPLELVLNPPHGGVRLPTFFDDYYNRVYFIPANINFGAISANVEREVVVWNAHFSPTELTDVTMVDAEGIAIASGPQPPYEFVPLGTRTYSILATTAGPETVTATIVFTFDTPETFDLELFGTRAKVSPLLPNWRKPYTVSYAFKTEIIASRSGKEQRRALRERPRKQITYESTPSYDQFRQTNRLLATWHNNTIVLPELPRSAELAQTLAPGQTIAHLDQSAPEWVTIGRTVILAYRNRYETRRIQQIEDTQLVFSGGSGTAWPVGTKVHPGLSGRLAASIRAKRLTNAVSEVNVVMDVTPGTEPEIALDAAPQTFNGRELFTTRPNWAAAPDITYESEREEVDYDRGRIEVFSPVDFTTRVTTLTFLGRNFDEADALRQFFERQRGQQGEFYMPTWEPDIQISLLAPAGTRALRIFGTEFGDEFGGSTVHRAVAVHLRDGSIFYRTVESIFTTDDADGQDSVVQVGENFPVDISPANVLLVSWMFVCRMATDTLTMEWVTNSVAQCQFTVRTLEDL